MTKTPWVDTISGISDEGAKSILAILVNTGISCSERGGNMTTPPQTLSPATELLRSRWHRFLQILPFTRAFNELQTREEERLVTRWEKEVRWITRSREDDSSAEGAFQQRVKEEFIQPLAKIQLRRDEMEKLNQCGNMGLCLRRPAACTSSHTSPVFGEISCKRCCMGTKPNTRLPSMFNLLCPRENETPRFLFVFGFIGFNLCWSLWILPRWPLLDTSGLG